MSDTSPVLEAMPSAAARSPGQILREFAEERPIATALVFSPAEGEERAVTWEELDRWTSRLARLLQQRGVDDKAVVVIGLPNCLEHVAAAFAAWKLGALVLPLSHRLPPAERDRTLEVASPTVVVAEWGDAAELTRDVLATADELSDAPLPDVVPSPGRALSSGGSTGMPKIIVDPRPLARAPLTAEDPLARLTGMRGDQTQLVSGPLYHNGPFMSCHIGLMGGHRVVVMDRFDAARVVELIQRHRVSWIYLVPTMMRRILDVPGVEDADLSSVAAMYHTAAHCPPDLKRAWLDLLAPERVYEGYGATEEVGLCAIRGDEWLEHPGSVGRPVDTEVKIVGADGAPCPPGEAGEVFMRRISLSETYRYIGAEPAAMDDEGFTSVGDMGWVDEDGYLYPADRRVDLIITGGSNVYPAEVEAVLFEHDAVDDAVVIGL
ncbi:MAG: AMP-binding protein, partial [Candidatus Limnocylindria bacterium]